MGNLASPTMIRFAGVGVVNTLIDLGLFLVLQPHLGITAANFVSTSAGMTFSFVVNGLFTFRAERLTLRHALLFVGTTGLVLWVLQPLLIHALLAVIGSLAMVKLAAIALSFGVNFLAYRHVVWPAAAVRSGRRP